jgi:hypothetical protein
MVLANDASVKRSYMLASRAGRLNSPALVVTHHDARLLPERLGPSTNVQFDRVLADVPCSGDGTLRKNPLIWKRWASSQANLLHSLQYQIGCKGVRLTKVGGRFVYSTCSLNPIENEAVVAGLLRTFGPGCVRLVDVSKELPGLPRRPGLRDWSVMHRGQWYTSWASLQAGCSQGGGGGGGGCPPFESLFAPAPDAAAGELHLERCVRMMPHEVDGSGFFVATFEKIGEHQVAAGALREDETTEICVDESADAMLPPALVPEGAEQQPRQPAAGPSSVAADEVTTRAAAPTKRDAGAAAELWSELEASAAQHASVVHARGGATVEAAAFAALSNEYPPLFEPAAAALDRLCAFFDVSDAFPRAQLVGRSPNSRQLLLVTDTVLSLLRADREGQLRVVHSGVRVFEREEAKGCGEGCGFRVVQDGLHHVVPFLGRRRQFVPCERTTARRILQTGEALLSVDQMKEHAPDLAAALDTGSCRAGSVVLEVPCDDEDDDSGRGATTVHMAALYAPSGALGHRVKPLERKALLKRLAE